MMPDQGDGDADADEPVDRARAALDAALDGLADAQDAEGAMEAGKREQAAIDRLVDGVANALLDGLDEPAGFYAGIAAEETVYFTKTDITAQITDRVEELQGADGPQPLNEFILDRLDAVQVTRVTDANQGAWYRWDFDTFHVETRSGGDGRGHFRWDHFRNLILESGGVNVGRPVKNRRSGDDWREFIVSVLDDRGATRTIEGPRTRAVDRLENRVTNLTGYGGPEAALGYGGIWVVREQESIPDWWATFGPGGSEPRDIERESVSEVCIPESVIDAVLEDLDVTRSGLYHELAARGHTLPRMTGVSREEWVDGRKDRFWVLRPTLAVPRVYKPDPYAEPTTDAPEPKGGEPVVEPDTDDESEPVDGFESVGSTR